MTGRKRSLIWFCVLLAVAAVFLLLYYCPFRRFFGITCPGCGMTRAMLAALRGDFPSAFAYHPLWPFLLPVGMYLVLSLHGMRIPHKQQNAYLLFLFVTVILVYMMRLYAGDPVVLTDETRALWFWVFSPIT